MPSGSAFMVCCYRLAAVSGRSRYRYAVGRSADVLVFGNKHFVQRLLGVAGLNATSAWSPVARWLGFYGLLLSPGGGFRTQPVPVCCWPVRRMCWYSLRAPAIRDEALRSETARCGRVERHIGMESCCQVAWPLWSVVIAWRRFQDAACTGMLLARSADVLAFPTGTGNKGRSTSFRDCSVWPG